MIRTVAGAVDIRKKRDPSEIKLHGGLYGDASKIGAVRIEAQWLSLQKKSQRQGFRGANSAVADPSGASSTQIEHYRCHVKQAMLIASTKLRITDLEGEVAIDPVTIQPFATPELRVQATQAAKKELTYWQDGSRPVPVTDQRAGQLTRGPETELERYAIYRNHRLIKIGKKTSGQKERYFAIVNGTLKVFHPHQWNTEAAARNEKPKAYLLAEAQARLEWPNMPGLGSNWHIPGYGWRVRVNLSERPQGPLYLYSKEGREAKNWDRAVRMSKYLGTPANREALRYVVLRTTGAAMTKAWHALFMYFREMAQLKQQVKNLAMRLMRADLSRGWNKARVVYLDVMQKEAQRQERMAWVGKMMLDRINSINNTMVHSPLQIRMDTINKVQQYFRRYRMERIMEHAYALGSSGRVTTRTQQAVIGGRMGISFDALTLVDVLTLVFTGLSLECLAKLQAEPDFFANGKKLQTSTGSMPTRLATMQISDNFSALTFAAMDERANMNLLATSDWAHFVNISDISSVVLHSERIMRKKGENYELHPGMTGGSWFTINGPRVCWGRKLREDGEVAGTADGCRLGRDIALGFRVRWLRLSVSVLSAFVPDPSPVQDKEGGTATKDRSDTPLDETERPAGTACREDGAYVPRQTYMVLHMLGRRFQCNRVDGKEPDYFGEVLLGARIEVSVPVPENLEDLSFLDLDEMTIDIVEWIDDPAGLPGTRQREQGKSRTIWSGTTTLWELFASSAADEEENEGGTKPTSPTRQSQAKQKITSLSKTLRTGGVSTRSEKRSVRLVQPWTDGREQLEAAFVELEGHATFEDAARPNWPVSPDLQGCGATTSLFSGYRGAWYDPTSEEAQLMGGKAPSFLEISLEHLRFPKEDKPDAGTVFEYHVEATVSGVTACSPGLHRAKAVWNRIVLSDPCRMNFEDSKVFVPLPPGAWCNPDKRPTVELTVVRSAPLNIPAVSYRDFDLGNGLQSHGASEREPVYRAVATIDGLLIDKPRTGLHVQLWEMGLQPPATTLGIVSDIEAKVRSRCAVLVCAACLRDREFVRLNAGPREPGQDAVVCIGEKAMLQIEEPLGYPQTKEEFALRSFQGKFDLAHTRRHALAGHFTPLREPLTSQEFEESGLAHAVPKETFNPPKRKHLVKSEDIIPHRFVMPSSELEFRRQAKPGLYWRILEKLVRDSIQTQIEAPADNGIDHKPMVVEELSHIVKQVPVTVLAVYPNRTCDLEVDESFMLRWEQKPDKHFHFPGTLHVEKFKDTSIANIYANPVGVGDVGERMRGRYLLQGVPLRLVLPVQAASFNIYDAMFGNVEAAIREHPLNISNGFNVRHSSTENSDDFASARRGGYYVRAGPLPSDVGVSAQYEWSLHVHARSEDDMYQFVTNLRQSAHLGFELQKKQLESIRNKRPTAFSTAVFGCTTMGSKSGHLEVVLVEARNLITKAVHKDKGLMKALNRSSVPTISALAVFRLVDETDGHRKELVYRGSKVQMSPIVPGRSPSWSQQVALKSSGGWVFKTPDFDPDSCPGANFELDIMNPKTGRPIGVVKVPLTGHLDYQYLASQGIPNVDFCSPHALDRFHNLWLPLSSRDPTTHEFVENICGEVHVMVLWVPVVQNTNEFKRLPKTAKAWKAHNMRPKLQLPETSLRDPSTELQARRAGYNPNLWVKAWPQSRSEAIGDFLELLQDTLPYLACCEHQSEVLWQGFCMELVNTERSELSLRELRSLGADQATKDQSFNDLSYRLNELLRRGVPPTWRRHVWMEVLGADDLKTAYLGEDWNPRHRSGAHVPSLDAPDVLDFLELVKMGRQLKIDAMAQLKEDCVGAAAWETSEAPGAMDRHLELVSEAQDVCVALILFCRKAGENNLLSMTQCEGGLSRAPVNYCESLLVLAFFFLIAQGTDAEDAGHFMEQAQHSDGRLRLERSKSVTSNTTWKSTDRETRIRAQHAIDADRAFWMLYTLVDSRAFRDYYAAPAPRTSQIEDMTPMASEHGAMQDVYRLHLCVSRFEPELWVHLEALGFQLSSVFYGAFMRLFAVILPPPSVFRFWDFLFAEVSDPNLYKPEVITKKPVRHALIDLAFGVLQLCKEQLMGCQSALEVKDCILSYFELLCDPSHVIEICAEAEFVLWDQSSLHSLMTPSHVQEFDRTMPFWEQHFIQFRNMNLHLRELVQGLEVGDFVGKNSHHQEPGAAPLDDTDRRLTTQNVMNLVIPPLDDTDRRVTTQNVMNLVIPVLQKAIMPSTSQVGTVGGMFRPTPAKLRHMGPELDTSITGQISSWASWVYERAMQGQAVRQDMPQPPLLLPRPWGAQGEPGGVDRNMLSMHTRQLLGGDWSFQLEQLYGAFQDWPQGHASVLEMFAAMVCSSKGTAGEKAMALFHLYGYATPDHRVGHISPVTHNAMSIIDKIQGAALQTERKMQRPPEDMAELKTMALLFRVQTYMSANHEATLGEVYVQSLRPFLWSGVTNDDFQSFTVFDGSMADHVGNNFNRAVRDKRRHAIGELKMSIMWTPADEEVPEVGQLRIYVDSLTFFCKRIEAPEEKNPKVTVCTFDDRGNEVPIKRWDPRTASQVASTIASQLILGDTYGEHIEFPSTKWRDAFGYLHDRGLGLSHHGWSQLDKEWKWDRRIGDQYSPGDLRMHTVNSHKTTTQKANMISLKSCRILAEGILQRSFHYMTNRQVALLADQVFSRCGAVPAILDAVLVLDAPGANLAQFEQLSELKEASVAFIDVRHHIVMAHEECVSATPGSINLFGASGSQALAQLQGAAREDGKLNLSNLKIKDPYAGSNKVLWIRYARAGDGQRFNAQYHVNEQGSFPSHELPLDMDADTSTGKIQMTLTKEEFVSCVLSSPVLSEALRKSTTFECDSREPFAYRPLQLEVAIADPMQEDADDEFLDSMNVQQSVCFEIYDVDKGSLSDFLGECYLPPFSEMSETPKFYVLELRGPTEWSRSDGAHKDPNKNYSGCLFVEASWKFPAEPVKDIEHEEATTLEQRAELEEKMHTGKLWVKILKAESMRNADVDDANTLSNRLSRITTGIMGSSRENHNDSAVWVYTRNETYHETAELPPGIGKGGWRVNMAGKHEPLHKTKVIKDAVMPEWNEEFEVKLQTGAYEKRTKQRRHFHISRKAAQRQRNEALLATMGNTNDLVMHFLDPNHVDTSRSGTSSRQTATPRDKKVVRLSRTDAILGDDDNSAPHGVTVLLGDSIFEFKSKMRKACLVEATNEEADLQRLPESSHDAILSRKRKAAFEAVARNLSEQFVVMVFVPSVQLLGLQRHRSHSTDYKNLYAVEYGDPSSWQPLDPCRTFGHYTALYGFGKTQDMMSIRLVIGSEDYMAKNNRYRHFVAEQKLWRQRIEQVNTGSLCFGYAKYVHRGDGCSEEWRPVIAERCLGDEVGRSKATGVHQSSAGSQKFQVTYIHAPMGVRSAGLDDASKVVVDESSLLLAPLQPEILASANLEHHEFLEKARQLEEEGLDEADIVRVLNERLLAKTQRRREAEAREGRQPTRLPSPISLRDVKHTLRSTHR